MSSSPEVHAGGRSIPRAAVAVGLVALAALHVAAWSAHPPDVDPINFTTALSEYDLSRDSPHPPGYPLYVGLGRLAALAVGPSRAYQAVNLGMLLTTTILLGHLGARLASTAAGLAAATLFATHPLVWAATVVPECYVTDALGGTAVVACALAGGRRPRVGVAGLAIIFLAVGLTRPTSCVLLLPAALVAGWLGTAPGRARVRYLALATTAALTALGLAYVMTVQLAGGPTIYRAAVDRVMGASFRSTSVLAGATVKAHLAMVAKLGGWFALLAAPIAVAWIAAEARRGPTSGLGSGRPLLTLVAAWVAPALAFYTLVYYLKPTYQLIYLPALQLLLGWALWRLAGGRLLATLGLAMGLAVAQLGGFWGGGPSWPAPVYRLTHSYVARQDAAWDKLEAAVGRLDDDVLIIYRSHPQLSAYALRLIAHGRPFALQGSDGRLSLNKHGRWERAEPGDLARFRSSVLVSSRGDQVQFQDAGPPPIPTP